MRCFILKMRLKITLKRFDVVNFSPKKLYSSISKVMGVKLWTPSSLLHI